MCSTARCGFETTAQLTTGVVRVHLSCFKWSGTELPTFRPFQWFHADGAVCSPPLVTCAGVEGALWTSACYFTRNFANAVVLASSGCSAVVHSNQIVIFFWVNRTANPKLDQPYLLRVFNASVSIAMAISASLTWVPGMCVWIRVLHSWEGRAYFFSWK